MLRVRSFQSTKSSSNISNQCGSYKKMKSCAFESNECSVTIILLNSGMFDFKGNSICWTAQATLFKGRWSGRNVRPGIFNDIFIYLIWWSYWYICKFVLFCCFRFIFENLIQFYRFHSAFACGNRSHAVRLRSVWFMSFIFCELREQIEMFQAGKWIEYPT